jgi:hypothetical protein
MVASFFIHENGRHVAFALVVSRCRFCSLIACMTSPGAHCR